MAREIDPGDTNRDAVYGLWMKAPNLMVTFFKTLDVANLVRVSKKRQMKFNMLLGYCIEWAAESCRDKDLSEGHMGIGTSAVTEAEINEPTRVLFWRNCRRRRSC